MFQVLRASPDDLVKMERCFSLFFQLWRAHVGTVFPKNWGVVFTAGPSVSKLNPPYIRRVSSSNPAQSRLGFPKRNQQNTSSKVPLYYQNRSYKKIERQPLILALILAPAAGSENP